MIFLKKAELLAPAGNMEKFKMALHYGADAVFMGGKMFNLRAGSSNFSDEELEEAVAYAHERGKRVYITLNIIPHNDELEALPEYVKFLEKVITLLYTSNSRTVSKSVSIFTTNYDLFIENSLDLLMKNENFIFNDGSNGYFHKVLDSSNYNKSVAYRGLNENYLNELPSISLIKPHGSMNWEKGENNQILIRPCTVNHPVIVRPTGLEGQETYLNNHFHDMLRVFQLELDKPQSVLIVIGFSFQDDHIAKMVRRSLKNPELMTYIFCYSDSDYEVIKKNLSLDNIPRNLQIVIPSALESENKNILNTSGNFDISSLTELFIIEDEEVK